MNSAVTLTPKALAEFLLHVALVRPVFIWGPPGIGKSSIVQQFAAEVGLECVSLLGSQLAPEDLIGVPQIIDGKSRFCPPTLIARQKPYCRAMPERCWVALQATRRAGATRGRPTPPRTVPVRCAGACRGMAVGSASGFDGTLPVAVTHHRTRSRLFARLPRTLPALRLAVRTGRRCDCLRPCVSTRKAGSTPTTAPAQGESRHGEQPIEFYGGPPERWADGHQARQTDRRCCSRAASCSRPFSGRGGGAGRHRAAVSRAHRTGRHLFQHAHAGPSRAHAWRFIGRDAWACHDA